MSNRQAPVRASDVVRFAEAQEQAVARYQEAVQRDASEGHPVREARPRGLLWSMDQETLVHHRQEIAQRMRRRPLVWLATAAVVVVAGAPFVALASLMVSLPLSLVGAVVGAVAINKEPEIKRFAQASREIARRNHQSQQDRFIEGYERASLNRMASGAEGPNESLADLARRRDAASVVLDRAIISWMGLEVHELDDLERSKAVDAAHEAVRLERTSGDVPLVPARESRRGSGSPEGWSTADSWTVG